MEITNVINTVIGEKLNKSHGGKHTELAFEQLLEFDDLKDTKNNQIALGVNDKPLPSVNLETLDKTDEVNINTSPLKQPLYANVVNSLIGINQLEDNALAVQELLDVKMYQESEKLIKNSEGLTKESNSIIEEWLFTDGFNITNFVDRESFGSMDGGNQVSSHSPVNKALLSNSASSEKILNERLLPISALANGYLSIINTNDKPVPMPSNTVTPLEQVSKNLNTKPIPRIDLPVQDSASTKQKVTAYTYMNQIAQKQSAFEATQEKIQRLAPTHANEFMRQHILLTNLDSGTTVWYRDYQMSESDKNSLKKRIADAELSTSLQITRVFINGALEWQKKELY